MSEAAPEQEGPQLFPMPARTRAGILTAAATAAAMLGAAAPAAAVVPTFERTDIPTPHRATNVALGDVTGDSRLDVVHNSLLGSALAIYPGAADGLLAPMSTFTLEPVTEWTSDVDLGDLDGDGDLDAVVLREYDLEVVRNDGSGGFEIVQTITTRRALTDVSIADITDDGLADVVGTFGHTMGNEADGGVIVWKGTDGATPLAEHARDSFIGIAGDSLLEDVNGDGHRDLVHSARLRVGDVWTFDAPDGLVVRYGDSTGSFGASRFFDAGKWQTTNYPRYFDSTGDGVKDLVASHINASTITTWRGLGGGEFGEGVTLFSSDYQGESALGDFDLDGRTDAAFPQGGNYRVDVFTEWRDGRGGTSVRLSLPRRYVYAVAAGDLDGDGRTDLVAASHDDYDPTRTLTVFRNTTVLPKACADGRDNDGDGKYDLSDPGCSSSSDDDETDPPPPPPPAQCADGSDNDGDGNVDGADAGCSSSSDDDESDDPEPPPPVEVLPWEGFFAPVNNLPTVNLVTAGRAIPVKFSLGGDRGLDVFAEGYPRSQQVECSSTADVDGIEETLTAGESGLTYDATADRYQYVWKTSDAWTGTCRQLVVKLRDGSSHRAAFKFR